MNLILLKKTAIVLLIFGILPLYSQEKGKLFQWKLEKDDVVELNEFHNVKFRIPGKEVLRQDKNRIALRVEECTITSCKLDGNFDTYVRYGNLKGQFRKEQNFESKFFIQKNGIYQVPDEYAVPNLRSVPGFPDYPIQPGDSWSMPAEESFNFNQGRIRIPVKADYTLLGPKEWRWNEHSGRGEMINYSYSLFYQAKKFQEGMPVKIYGLARGEVYFDPIRGLPQFKENKLTYTFVYADGQVTEANFHIFGVYQNRKTLTEAAKDDFKNKIEGELGIQSSDTNPSSLNVRRTDEGISISMDSILFDSEKYDLKPDAIVQLEKISEVLKRHPTREVRISGHTDNSGGVEYNKKLSEERAKSVLNALVDQFKLETNRLSYQGHGDKKPIASNSTEEGRKKNRRVDITIVVE
jgi:outer membrane protein OmpA-like peptidoglycan-associated protein